MDKIEEVLTRGVEKIYPSKEALEEVLRSGKKIKLYQGFDPSMPSLHLGNFVGLMKLRQFQKLGHEVIFLVGDFTGMIGDPTDKSSTRQKLTRDETLRNAKAWREQVSRVLRFEGENPAEIKFNSEWLDKVTFKDLIEATSNFTVQQMIERDMFQKRLSENKPIHLHEFLYPISVAIDCVEMNVDLEIGGSDQLFNMMAGRTLMKAVSGKEKYVLTTKLLVDKEGNKVGKTTGNALFLDSDPDEFFASVMSFPDEAVGLGFELLTELSLDGLAQKIEKDPMGQKKNLAFEIVKLLWGEKCAKQSQENFEKTFQEKAPSQFMEVDDGNIIQVLAPFTSLKSITDAKRWITQGAVDVNGKTLTDPDYQLKKGDTVKAGKKVFLKVK